MRDNSNLKVLHLEIQDLLAGYVDDSLSETEKYIVEVHLAGCQACRMDVERQQQLSRRLNHLTHARLPAHLQQKLDRSPEQPTPMSGKRTRQDSWRALLNGFKSRFQIMPIITLSGWVVAMVLMLVLLPPLKPSDHQHTVPMVAQVLAEYQSAGTSGQFNRHSKVEVNAPASWPDARVLASWETSIGGAPATAYAVRSGNQIVFQYAVTEKVFFRNPVVRMKVAKEGRYQAKEEGLMVVALPVKKAGLLIVGPEKAIPEIRSISL